MFYIFQIFHPIRDFKIHFFLLLILLSLFPTNSVAIFKSLPIKDPKIHFEMDSVPF